MKYSILALIMTVIGYMAAPILKWPAFLWLLWGLGCIGIAVLGLIFHYSVPSWSIFIGILCLSAFYYCSWHETYVRDRFWNSHFDAMQVTVEGTAVTRVEYRPDGCRLTLQTAQASRSAPVGRLMVYYKGSLPEDYYGRRLRLTGKFKKLPEDTEVLPGFYETRWLTGRMTVTARPTLLHQPGLPGWYLWSEDCHRRLSEFGRENLKPDQFRLLNGMIFGEDLPDDFSGQKLKREFRRTGTIHLLTVSGLHVGFIILGLNFLFGLCRIPKCWRPLPLGLGIWFYIAMTGMEPPVLRSGIMLTIYISGRIIGAKDDPLNRLCLAGWILLLINPYNLFDPGFQLSFSATLGIVWIYPTLKRIFPTKISWLNPAWQVILLSVSAQLSFIPITVYYFQQISWGSPAVNLLIGLPAELAVVGGFIGELVGIILPELGKIILFTVAWNLELIQVVVSYFSTFSWMSAWCPVWPWPWVVGYYLGLLLLVDGLQPNLLSGRPQINPGTAWLVGLILLNGIVWAGLTYSINRNCLEVTLIDVGQGDAILLRGPHGGTVLIDAGDEGRGRGRVLPVLRRNGIDHLDLVLGTHGHRDHLGGMDEVLSEVSAPAVYLPSCADFKTVALRQFQIELHRLGIPLRKLKNGTRFRLDRTVWAEAFYSPEATSENDRSLILLIHYGKNKLLLTGDLSMKGEKMIIRKYGTRLRAGGMKVGHHGSNLASTTPFLTQVQPDFAVIMVGADNRFGHPGAKTLHRMKSLGIKVFRTDIHGLIHLQMFPDKTVLIPTKGGL